MQTLAQPVHIIGPFSSGMKSGVWTHALGLYEALRTHMRVELWSEQAPSADLKAYSVREIRPFQSVAPLGGTLIFVGMSEWPGLWYEHAAPHKVILECTMFAPAKLYKALNRLMLGGQRDVEVRYSSDLIRQLCAVPGPVTIPVNGLEQFLAVDQVQKPYPFTIGKVSRDTLEKHHFRDIPLYRKLASEGFRINIVGGTCLRPYVLEEIEGLALLPEIPREALPEFFGNVNCFFYRTPLHCVESIGFVVLEAMASGLPVIAQRFGGYREVIVHGENGYLFDTDDEACEIMRYLARSPDAAYEIGSKAKATMTQLVAKMEAGQQQSLKV